MRQSERLIEAVRVRPYLYDQTLQTFKHVGMKKRNWIEVAKIVYGKDDKGTVNKAKIQWKSLRDAFVKQQRKRQLATSKVRPYIYETEMQFLQPHILVKDREDNGSSTESSPTKSFDVKTEDSISLNGSLSGDSHLEVEEDEPQSPPEEIPWETQKTYVTSKEQHPVDAFFHGIAQTVKQLKPHTVAKVKKAVANIVMDAEIEEIEKEAEELK